MADLIHKIKKYLTEPLLPPLSFLFSRTCLGGIHYSAKEKTIDAHFILPLSAGLLEPSFDKKNIINGRALEGKLREGVHRLGAADRNVLLLIPEACLKVFLLAFDNLPSSIKERENLIRWRLNKLLPLQPSDLRMSYDVMTSEGGAKIILVLARAAVIQEYESLLARLDLKVKVIGLPSLALMNFLKQEPTKNALVANIEADSISLLAVAERRAALYRFKPFLQDATRGALSAQKWEQVVTEVQNTIQFMEDREQKKIGAVWVRSALPIGEGDGLAILKEKLSVPVKALDFSLPRPLSGEDKQILSPLVGQMI